MVELYHAYYRDNVQWNMDRYHFHTQYEILLTVAGHAKIFITDRCYQLEKGRLLLIHPSVIHRSFCQTAGNYQRYIVHIPESTLLALSTDQSNLLSIFSLTEQLYTLSEKQLQQIIPLFQACMEKPIGFGADIRQSMSLAALLLQISSMENTRSLLPIEDNHPFPSYITYLLHYIPENLAFKMTLDSLANQLFISKAQLSRMFRSCTGFSVLEFIIQSRICAACQYLKNGYRVVDVYSKVGFSNYAHFCRSFQKFVGVSPGKYRLSEFQHLK